MFRRIAAGLTISSLACIAGCASGSRHAQASGSAAAHSAHEAYVAAINSNNLDTLMAVLTDDVVYMAPNTPRLVGKAAVRAWAVPYLEAYEIHWDKTTLEFIDLGDWAIEQYSYVEHDRPRGGGPVLQDTGKGINIYRRGSDGKWRVARDAWNSDLPAAGQ